MSDRARNYVKSLALPWHVKSLLFLIADFHNVKEGCAWPGLATLAELTGQDPRNVKRTIRAAEKTGKFRFIPGLGQGNKGKFYFLELKAVAVTALRDSKAVTKEVISNSAIRNEPLNQDKTLPNPPFQGGNQKSLTARQLKTLNEEIQFHLRAHVDQFGHARWVNGVPVQSLALEEAVSMACQRLLLPLDQAWAAIRAAGVGQARKEPQSVAG